MNRGEMMQAEAMLMNQAVALRNPYRGGERQLLRELRRALREQAEALRAIG